jgi:hypothetical protein
VSTFLSHSLSIHLFFTFLHPFLFLFLICASFVCNLLCAMCGEVYFLFFLLLVFALLNYQFVCQSLITETYLGTQFGAVRSTSQAAKYRVGVGLLPLLLIFSNFDIFSLHVYFSRDAMFLYRIVSLILTQQLFSATLIIFYFSE